MFDKIKGLMQVKDELDKAVSSCEENSRAVAELTSEIKRLGEASEKNAAMQEKLTELFRQSMG